MLKRWIRYNKVLVINAVIVIFVGSLCLRGWFISSNKTDSDAVSIPDETQIVEESAIIEEAKEQVIPAGFTTVGKIKEKYNYSSNIKMCVNNVDQSQPFQIKFNSSNIGREAVTVHTDIDCEASSKVDINYDIADSDDGGTVVTISPKVGVLLSSEALNRKYSSKNCVCWGYAPIYYIRINYSVSSEIQEQLEEPMIIPFTVRSETDTPLLKIDISNDGVVKLKWTKVSNADSYRIYYVDNNTKETSNKRGFNGCFPYLVGEAGKDTDTWSNWLGNEDGLSSIAVNNDYVAEQNSGLKGEWFVTAVYQDIESNFSNSVNVNSVISTVPHKVSHSELDVSKKIKGVSQLPALVNIESVDGSFSAREVDYTVDKSNIYDWRAYYRYKIPGTKLKGILAVDLQKGDEVKSSIKNSRTICTDNRLIENKSISSSGVDTKAIITGSDVTVYKLMKECYSVSGIDKSESPEIRLLEQYVLTGVPVSGSSITSEEISSDNYIMAQIINTTELENYGDLELVKLSSTDNIKAENAIEEYLGNCISNRNTKISLKAFPEYQNNSKLEEVMQNMQNVVMEAMDIQSYKYDSSDLTIHIVYQHSDKDCSVMKSAISNKIKTIVNKLKSIKEEYKKAEWIYKYLEENVRLYTTDTSKKGNEAIDSAYGALILGKASSLGNARAFKLISDSAGLESKIVNGLYSGYRKHVWNLVNYDGKWYNIDCTNNKRNSSIGYTILNNGMNERYKQNEEIVTASDKYSYYNKNGLVANNKSSFWKIVAKGLKDKKKEVVIRYDGKDANTDIIAYATTFLKKNRKAYKIKNFRLGRYDNYYIVSI